MRTTLETFGNAIEIDRWPMREQVTQITHSLIGWNLARLWKRPYILAPENMVDILLATVSNASLSKCFKFKFHWSIFLGSSKSHHWFRLSLNQWSTTTVCQINSSSKSENDASKIIPRVSQMAKTLFAILISINRWHTVQRRYYGIQGGVSLTFREHSKIISRKYTMPEITFMVRISSWNFLRVPRALLWAYV